MRSEWRPFGTDSSIVPHRLMSFAVMPSSTQATPATPAECLGQRFTRSQGPDKLIYRPASWFAYCSRAVHIFFDLLTPQIWAQNSLIPPVKTS